LGPVRLPRVGKIELRIQGGQGRGCQLHHDVAGNPVPTGKVAGAGEALLNRHGFRWDRRSSPLNKMTANDRSAGALGRRMTAAVWLDPRRGEGRWPSSPRRHAASTRKKDAARQLFGGTHGGHATS